MNNKLIFNLICLMSIVIPLIHGYPYGYSHEDEDDDHEDDKWPKYGRRYQHEEDDHDDRRRYYPYYKKDDDDYRRPKWTSGGWRPLSRPIMSNYGHNYHGVHDTHYKPKHDYHHKPAHDYHPYKEKEVPKKKVYKEEDKKEDGIEKDILKEIDKYIPEVDFIEEDGKKKA